MKGERRVDNEVLTVQEAAKLLRINQYTVYGLLRTHRLDGFKITRRWRILKSSVDKFISGQSDSVRRNKK